MYRHILSFQVSFVPQEWRVEGGIPARIAAMRSEKERVKVIAAKQMDAIFTSVQQVVPDAVRVQGVGGQITSGISGEGSVRCSICFQTDERLSSEEVARLTSLGKIEPNCFDKMFV